MSQQGQRSVQVLLDAGADTEVEDTYGYTPLMRAASNNLTFGGRALAEHLLTNGKDLRQKSSITGEDALDIAVDSRNYEFAEMLTSLTP